ncbi:hypothetical protein DR64_769 [Paraburkholderia xenovorans LB400]|uniref:hypothetical protein n=1 Tax=Paraburkholderia xenovorans TaxID=36873 RepID=UPI0002E09E54|nr:hypothetical protein [Paraburkholderia xenovorans]AIP33491.1 hypothetical protein DR64_769 [Paraburkholderia xenovorans LB400]
MKYEEAKAVCEKAFAAAELRVGADEVAVKREVSLMAARDRILMRALHVVTKHESSTGQS